MVEMHERGGSKGKWTLVSPYRSTCLPLRALVAGQYRSGTAHVVDDIVCRTTWTCGVDEKTEYDHP